MKPVTYLKLDEIRKKSFSKCHVHETSVAHNLQIEFGEDL